MSRPLTIGERQKLRTAEQRQASRAKGTETRRKNKLALAQPKQASRSPAEKPTAALVTMDMPARLRAACIGHPFAKIPWPHRLLHDAAMEIERLEASRADSFTKGVDTTRAFYEAMLAERKKQAGQAAALPAEGRTPKSFWQRVKAWWRT